MKPLHESFDKMTDCSTNISFVDTAIEWARQNMSQSSLRPGETFTPFFILYLLIFYFLIPMLAVFVVLAVVGVWLYFVCLFVSGGGNKALISFLVVYWAQNTKKKIGVGWVGGGGHLFAWQHT